MSVHIDWTVLDYNMSQLTDHLSELRAQTAERREVRSSDRNYCVRLLREILKCLNVPVHDQDDPQRFDPSPHVEITWGTKWGETLDTEPEM